MNFLTGQRRKPVYRRAILHIGMQKTGTTSLQKTFRQNIGALASQGVSWPVCEVADFVHIETLFMAMGEDSPAGLRQRYPEWRPRTDQFLKRIAANPDGHSVLALSAEHLFQYMRTKRQTRRLIEWLKAHAERVELLVYLRDQVTAIPSTWAQGVKSGLKKDLASLLAQPDFLDGFDYAKRLSIWEAALPREAIKVCAFEPEDFPEGDVRRDFLQRLGISPDHLDLDVASANPSLDAESADLVRALNEALGDAHAGLRRKAVRFALDRRTAQPPALSESQRRETRAYFAASNRLIEARYFQNRPLFETS